MKKILTLIACSLSFWSVRSDAQIFWNENFETGAATGLEVSSYTSANGSWTLTLTGSEGGRPNPWYVSCQEAGHIAGGCGTTCTGSFGLGATLHIGADPIIIGDAGASYDAGGVFNTTTDRRAESPTINCTGHTGITLRFYYIENGQAALDDGSVWYYDGSTWALLVNTPKTSLCGAQGQWDVYSTTLPASADNNPNVKIGFRWVNNNDGAGTDPSFAIDSVTLSTASSAVTPPVASLTASSSSACQDSCITITNTSTGTVDSFRIAAMPTTSVTISGATSSPATVCFHAAGTYTVSLTAYNSGGSSTATSVITVNPAPHPVITKTGHTLSVTGSYTSYQWQKNSVDISGATNASYTYSVAATYTVIVDSAGCRGSATFSTLGTPAFNNTGESYWLSHSGDMLNIYASGPLAQSLNVAVYDATGRKMYSEAWKAGSELQQVSTAFFPPGIYIVRLTNENTSTVMKFIR